MTQAEGARVDINGWVSDRTEAQIPELFPQGSINGLTRLVLANAVFFHGDWKKPFSAQQPERDLPRARRRRLRADDGRQRQRARCGAGPANAAALGRVRR